MQNISRVINQVLGHTQLRTRDDDDDDDEDSTPRINYPPKPFRFILIFTLIMLLMIPDDL